MIYNCHIHTFMDKDVPERFLPLGLVRMLSKKEFFRVASKILNHLNPWSDNDVFDRYVRVAKISKKGSQQSIFEYCQQFYPELTRFFVISMDMAFMGCGKVPRPYQEQLAELAALKKQYPQVFPFVHIDPRRNESFDLLRKCVESWDFCGIKIYPNIGYFPYDEALNKIYEYCQQHHLPVITHCSPHNPVYFKGKYRELYTLLKKSKTPVDLHNKSKRELCAYFSFPLNWIHVVEAFPGLKICFAHFGSAEQWQLYLNEPEAENNWYVMIREMIKKWPQLFADISFTLYERDLFPLLKLVLHHPLLQQKILFGSDYYMVESEATERRFGIDLRAYLGEDFFKLIANDNPARFISNT